MRCPPAVSSLDCAWERGCRPGWVGRRGAGSAGAGGGDREEAACLRLFLLKVNGYPIHMATLSEVQIILAPGRAFGLGSLQDP